MKKTITFFLFLILILSCCLLVGCQYEDSAVANFYESVINKIQSFTQSITSIFNVVKNFVVSVFNNVRYLITQMILIIVYPAIEFVKAIYVLPIIVNIKSFINIGLDIFTFIAWFIASISLISIPQKNNIIVKKTTKVFVIVIIIAFLLTIPFLNKAEQISQIALIVKYVSYLAGVIFVIVFFIAWILYFINEHKILKMYKEKK